MLHVSVILGSTRPNRRSEIVGEWVMMHASQVEGWKVELVDLRDWPLPFYQEAASVMALKGEYSIPLAKAWSKKIAAFDAFIMIAPEYNHGYPAVLKNALDYLYEEWNEKPVTFVSYGSVGGARGIEQLRQVVAELRMVDIRETLPIMNIPALITDGVFHPEEIQEKKLATVTAQLDWWGRTLKAARAEKGR